jgi:hypothetical protein
LQPALLDDDEFLWSEAMLLACVRAADARRLSQLFGERVYLDRYRTQRRNEAAQAPTLVGTTVRVGVDFAVQSERAIRDPWSLYDATNGGLHVEQAAILQSPETLTYRAAALPTSSVDCGPNPTIGSPGPRWTGPEPELSVRFEPTAGGTIDFLPLDAAVARSMVGAGLTFVPGHDIVEAGMRVEQELLDGSGTLVLRGPIVDLLIEYHRTSPHEAQIGTFGWDGSGNPPWFRGGAGLTGPGR